MYNHICESIKKSTKKFLIDKILKRLLEPELKSNHSIKSRRLNLIVNMILPSV